MTLYFSGPEDGRNGEKGKTQIIENHPEYVEYDDEGRLIINIDEMPRDEKRKTLANVAVSAVDASEIYNVVTEPEFEWVGGDD